MHHIQSWVLKLQKMPSVRLAIGEKHTCQLCGYQTLKKTLLELHVQAVHDGKKFQCTECEYQATEKSKLISHQKSVQYGQKIPMPRV